MSEMYEALSAAPALNVIPESCISFSEQAMYVAEFANSEFYHMIESIGVEELREYELNESTVIYEGEKLDSLKEKIKTYITKVFGAIKTLFTNVKKYFDTKSKAAKSLNITKDILNDIPDGTMIGKTHTFFDFKKVKFGEKATRYGKEVDKTFKALAGASRKELKDATNMLEEKMIPYITGVNTKSLREMKKEIKKECIGQEVNADKAWLAKNFKNIHDFIYGVKIENDIKNAYNVEKKALDTLYKTCSDSCDDPKYADVAPYWCGVIEDVIITANYAYGVVFDNYKRMYSELVNLLIKAQKIAKKNAKKSVKEEFEVQEETKDLIVDESYTNEYDLVASAFDF